MKKTSLAGGAVQELADVISPRGGTWRGGNILFATAGNADISRISDTGGDVSAATTRSDGENSHRYPSFLPDARHFLYFARNPINPERSGVWLGSLDDESPRQLVNAFSRAVFAEPGFLVYRRGENLFAHPFDSKSLELVGEATVVADGVWFDPAFSGLSNFSASNDGSLAYRGGGMDQTELVWWDREGNPESRIGEVGNYLNLFLAPNGRFVSVSRTNERTESRDLWLIDLRTGVERQLTFNPSSDFVPVWASNSTIVFASDRAGTFNIYEQASAGGAEVVLPFANEKTKWVRHASSDGAWVLYDEIDSSSGDVNIGILNRRTGETSHFRRSDDHDWFGRLSPDGRWIAYTSNELGTYEVFVESFPRSGAHWKVSSGEGFQPVWNPKGNELFYLATGGTLMSVAVDTDGISLDPGPARALFDTGVSVGSVIQPDSLNHYDFAADGDRFLTLRKTESLSPSLLMLDWQATLARER